MNAIGTSFEVSGLARLVELGQSAWYDNLTRPLARGGLHELIESLGITGVTSNPTIFEKSILAGNDYADQLLELKDASPTEKYWALVVDDIRSAADCLTGVYDKTGGHDGYVSVEVSPLLARDAAGTIDQAKALFERIGRANVMIKIPATREGLPAITEVVAAGINVNVTLIFSLDRYEAVIDAYLAGISRLEDPSTVASVASFFVSRVDSETDKRLPSGHAARGKVAVANAKLAYELFESKFSAPSFAQLFARGARVQRPLWASTSTKNPDYSPTLYVAEIVGENSVNTLAPASIDALAAAVVMNANSVRSRLDEARQTIASLASAGVDFADVTLTLETEGVESFAASYSACLDALART